MKRKSLVLFLVISLFGFCISGFGRFYEKLTPEERKELARYWLEAGYAFESVGKKENARWSFLHTFILYPLGPEGKEALKILTEKYGMKLESDPDTLYKEYINLSTKYIQEKKYNQAINALLMALEFKPQEPYPYYRLAYINYKYLNEKEKAKEYLQQAINLKFPEKEIDPELKQLLQEK